MSSAASGATLDLRLRASARALRWLVALHAGAILLTLAARPPHWAGLGMAILFAASWASLRRHPAFGYGPRALARLVRHPDGNWTLENAAGAQDGAELLGSSAVLGELIVLNFRLKSGARRSRVLLGDETDAESLRRLRARLLA
ncbi:MAG: hypothetical protein ISP90_07450 [Nevskia sp.]|nr:hypothetical protein [Nevskia sp.]